MLVEENVVLHRVEKELPKNQVAFKCAPHLTRPEIAQYLRKVYGLGVQEVRTLNRVGRVSTDASTGSELSREVQEARHEDRVRDARHRRRRLLQAHAVSKTDGI